MTKEEVRQLKKDRFLMLRRQRDLDATEEFLLSGWTENYPLLHDLYFKKERFYEIWEHNHSRKSAELAYKNWQTNMKPEIRDFFSELERAVENRYHEIFNYFDYRITNAYTESVNNYIKSIARQGRGYSFEVLRAKTLFTNATYREKPKSFRSEFRKINVDLSEEVTEISPDYSGNIEDKILNLWRDFSTRPGKKNFLEIPHTFTNTLYTLPVVHLGNNDFQIVCFVAVTLVKPLDQGQGGQFGEDSDG